MDINEIEADALNSIIELTHVENYPYDFTVNLSGRGLVAGTKVYIFAFLDQGYTGGLPSLNEGDILGFYINESTYDLQYTLKEGVNNYVEIDISRTVYDFDATLSGHIFSPEKGDVMLVAYAGEMNSLDFSEIDINSVVGFKKLSMSSETTSFTLDIFPYGYDLPIEGVYVFAFLDRNKNGSPDDGDLWGCLYDDDGYPAVLTITEEEPHRKNIAVTLENEISESSGDHIVLDGSFTAPDGYGWGSPPVFIIISQSENPQQIFENTVGSVKHFEKIAVPETSFSLDLSDSGLAPGDEVMIIALWDLDYVSGFPRLSQGDLIGYYMENGGYSYHYELQKTPEYGTNPNTLETPLTLEKIYEENNAVVEGTILDNDGGDYIIVAYTGEFDSMDMEIDTNLIVGYESMSGAAGYSPYTMDILPFTAFPLEDIYIIGVKDNNKNGEPDSGDSIGFYSNNSSGIPSQVTLVDGVQTGFDIEFTMDYTEPVQGGTAVNLIGSIEAPAGYTSDEATKPVFIVISDADDPTALIDDPVGSMKYFTRLPQGETGFTIELDKAGLVPGDQIMVIALWDKDYEGGFPDLTEGDMMGYYIDQESYSFHYELAAGDNTGVTIPINRTYAENDATIQGTILNSEDNESGNVILIAYNGEIDSLDMDIDTDMIIGYDTMTKESGADTPYSMGILPFVTFPQENVYVFAILDNNGNGVPDAGDRVGFYADPEKGIPALLTITNGVQAGIDIEFSADYVEADPGAAAMTLTGSFVRPSGYTSDESSKPIFIIIATGDDTFALIEDPMSVIRYFVKLPQGANTFTIDLAAAGVQPGEEVRIVAIWDRDYTGGFPYPDAGDKIGYYQREDNENGEFLYAFPVYEGANNATHNHDGWVFTIDQTLYNHDMQIRFEFTRGDLSSSYVNGKDVVIILAHQSGVDDNWYWVFPPSYAIINMDCIIGINILENVQLGTHYTARVFPFIYDGIPKNTSGNNLTSISDVYIYAILDANGNGWPDSGEYIGFYGQRVWLSPYMPDTYDTLYNGVNDIGTIRFTDNQY